MSRQHRRHKIIAAFLVLLAIGGISWLGKNAWNDYLVQEKKERRDLIFAHVQKEFDRFFHEGGDYPKNTTIVGEQVSLEYGINTELEDYIKKLVSRYRSAYTAVVVMDNESGQILASIGHTNQTREFDSVLPFTATHPAASLFKIITAADLLENTPVTEDSRFKFHGRGTTLYRRQLESTNNRWTRYQTLEKAFAYSNNVVFGKAAINQSNSESLMNMAYEFGFNRDLMDELHLSRSVLDIPEDQYNLAELASGFNRETLISPVHGAALAAVVANGGLFVTPRLLQKVSVDVIDENLDSEIIWQGQRKTRQVLSPESAAALRSMMELTVERGTARGSFRRFDRKLRHLVTIGGKTGTITGGMPDGRRDWFTSFAIPRDPAAGRGISVCVMIVNGSKWYVKSAYMAKEIIEYYYKRIMRIENAFLKDASSRKAERGEGRS